MLYHKYSKGPKIVQVIIQDPLLNSPLWMRSVADLQAVKAPSLHKLPITWALGAAKLRHGTGCPERKREGHSIPGYA